MLTPWLIGFVALEHVGFFLLEAVLWQQPAGRRVFGTTPEHAALMAPMAANQGLYNLFLAAGLVWSLMTHPGQMGRELALFFLGCVAVAAVFGGFTVKRSIWVIQGGPAALAMAALLLAL
jgi:putative membrane protein